MNDENFKSEKESRRFLLGEMADEERAAFEARFIADAELFAQIQVVEDELIEDFILGRLSAAEKEKFEKSFLSTARRRERLAFSREMLAELKTAKTKDEKMSVFESFLTFFQKPRYAFAAALILLLAAFAGWLMLKTSVKKETEISKEAEPQPSVSFTPQPRENNSNSEIAANKSPANTGETNANIYQNKGKSSEPPKPKPFVAALALFAGTVRSEGKTSELNLPENAGGVNLQLNLEAQDYKTYRAEILDAEGNSVWRSGRLSARNLKINAFVPAARLKQGDYRVKLYGQTPDKRDESAADYTFRVIRK